MSVRPLAVFVSCSLLLSSSVALAQPATIDHQDPSRGATLPPTSPALADEATALIVNPAGLSQLRSFQLFYLHERSIGRGETIDAIYAGNTLFDGLGVGFGIEWVRPGRRKTSWGLSLGSERFSLGGSLAFFSSDESRFLDQAQTLDLGVMTRPFEQLSLGATVRNLNEPREGALVLPRSYDLAVGVRPFGERLTFGVDYLFDESRGVTDGRLSYVLQGEVKQGILVSAGASHGFGPADPLAIQVGLTVNLSNLGATYAVGSAGDGLDHVFLGRLSAADYPGLTTGRGKVAMLDLSNLLGGEAGGTISLIGGRREDPYLELTRLLAQAERDQSLAGVVVKLESLPEVGLGRADELRRALLRLRAAGKKVIAVIFTAGDTEYLVASGADQIYLVPQSTLLVNGIAANVIYLGGAMEKLGVEWDVARVGAYKNAPDQFTRRDMSDEQRETIEAYLDTQIDYLVTTIAQMRKLPVEQVRGAMREGLLTPKRAVELGLVDGVIQPVDLDDKLKAVVPGASFAGDYGFEDRERRRWGSQPRIAIIPVVGAISSGKSREDPVGFAEIAGAETVIQALREAQEDPGVAAIVIRVDSGGGDALASDLMYRAVLEAKQKKPVVASMGDVAASGGYYAAMGAHEIFAEPTTLTGSIGIFMIKPAVGPLAQKLGVRQETIKRGELANLLNNYEPWTPEERQAAEKWVLSFYDDFITEVARSRNLEKGKVDEVARGRVWAGLAAKDIGLVDELGSLQEAIDAARRRADIPDGEPYTLEVIGEPRGFLSPAAGPLVRAATAALPAPTLPSPVPAQVEVMLKELGLPSSVLFEPGAKAMLPFQLQLH